MAGQATMTLRRCIKSKHFLGDIRSGMTANELMKKYGLSSDTFRQVLQSIIHFQRKGRNAGVDFRERRRYPRTVITYPLWVYDHADQIEDGRVLDVSEKGVCIEGITAMVGETRTFIVKYRKGERRKPFVFDAMCRWVSANGGSSREYIAGFEITNISQGDIALLMELIEDATGHDGG